jgi:histidine triad (HIT) family protein
MSLTGDYDTNNVFAKILRGDMPCVKVYEDDAVLSFMDVFPQSRGHVLVIPKAPSRNLFDASPQTVADLITKTQKIGQAVKSALSPDGIVITQFNGAAAGQTVFHLHFHIIPRYDEIGLNQHASGRMADMEELSALAAQIKAAL